MGDKLAALAARPATIVLTTQLDARYLATLALFWHNQGEQCASMSQLIRLSTESLCDLLVSDGHAEFVQTQEAALEIIERLGLKIKKTLGKNLASALLKEDGGSGDFLTRLTKTRKVAPKHEALQREHPISQDSPDFLHALADLEAASAEELSERVKLAQSKTEDFKTHLGIIPTNLED